MISMVLAEIDSVKKLFNISVFRRESRSSKFFVGDNEIHHEW